MPSARITELTTLQSAALVALEQGKACCRPLRGSCDTPGGCPSRPFRQMRRRWMLSCGFGPRQRTMRIESQPQTVSVAAWAQNAQQECQVPIGDESGVRADQSESNACAPAEDLQLGDHCRNSGSKSRLSDCGSSEATSTGTRPDRG
jgi:hypothetical protein